MEWASARRFRFLGLAGELPKAVMRSSIAVLNCCGVLSADGRGKAVAPVCDHRASPKRISMGVPAGRLTSFRGRDTRPITPPSNPKTKATAHDASHIVVSINTRLSRRQLTRVLKTIIA